MPLDEQDKQEIAQLIARAIADAKEPPPQMPKPPLPTRFMLAGVDIDNTTDPTVPGQVGHKGPTLPQIVNLKTGFTADLEPGDGRQVNVHSLGSGTGAATTEPYLTTANTSGLSAERAISPRFNIFGTDAPSTPSAGNGSYFLDSWVEGAPLTTGGPAILTLGTDGDMFHIGALSGDISSIAVPTRQNLVLLVFDSTITITHSASLILAGAVDYNTTAGDALWFMYEGAGVWREVGRHTVLESSNSEPYVIYAPTAGLPNARQYINAGAAIPSNATSPDGGFFYHTGTDALYVNDTLTWKAPQAMKVYTSLGESPNSPVSF